MPSGLIVCSASTFSSESIPNAPNRCLLVSFDARCRQSPWGMRKQTRATVGERCAGALHTNTNRHQATQHMRHMPALACCGRCLGQCYGHMLAHFKACHGRCLLALSLSPRILNHLYTTLHTCTPHSAGGVKTRLERCGAPAFTSMLEVISTTKWRLHPNLAESVDALLAAMSRRGAGRDGRDGGGHQGGVPNTEIRWYEGAGGGRMMVQFETWEAAGRRARHL